MANNERSKHITEGVTRAPNRSMYYGMGYKESDFANPMIGVANGHSTITPCNSGLQPLVDAAIAAIREAKGNPQVFGTPTISDGMSMGQWLSVPMVFAGIWLFFRAREQR